MKYSGLSLGEVKKLQFQYGSNSLPQEKTIPAIKIFLSQFANPLIYLLFLAGLISLFLQKYLDIIFIFSVVILNSFFGFFQEYKAQQTLVALKRMIKPRAKVLRDNKRQEINALGLVPGDIVFLSVGDKVPADGKLLEAVSLFVNEAILTGESEAVLKEKKEEVSMGTIIVGGRAVMRVMKIGMETKIGKIAKTLKETSQPLTTLQQRFKKVTRTLIYLSLFLSVLLFSVGFLTGKDFWEMVQMAAIILVAIIPEAMLIVITLILVVAMQKTLKKKALIRKLLAVETLGSVTTICTDKTGTLTEGKMKVSEADFIAQETSLLTMCLCNDLSDTAEISLWDYLENQEDFSPQETFDKYKRVSEIPFSSDYKFMATVNYYPTEYKKDFLLSVKGAPEIVLAMSSLQKEEKKIILEKIDKWAKSGLKVLGLASKKISSDDAKSISIKTISSLEWGGIVGLWDPPRKEVKDALAAAKKAGIKVKVVTGDYRHTAEKIMEFLDLKVKKDQVLEGIELEKLSDKELKDRVLDTLLFARITPHQKLRIVSALQDLGEIVAMTGDGVNDTPALKKSNIGIVVGEASEVAKETADLILLDSNFKTIISAVEEGRVVFENIKKVIFFMLSNSFAEVVLILASIILGWPMPLTIIQILWLHFLTDGPEDIVLGFEPKEKEIMLEGPKKIDYPILDRTSISLIFVISFLSGLFSLWLFWYFGLHQGNMELGRTMALMSISFNSILYIFSCRSFRKPFWLYENFWKNKWLFIAVFFSLASQISITYIPFTQKILNVIPLGLSHWGLLLAAAIVIILIIEGTKAGMQKRTRT